MPSIKHGFLLDDPGVKARAFFLSTVRLRVAQTKKHSLPSGYATYPTDYGCNLASTQAGGLLKSAIHPLANHRLANRDFVGFHRGCTVDVTGDRNQLIQNVLIGNFTLENDRAAGLGHINGVDVCHF